MDLRQYLGITEVLYAVRRIEGLLETINGRTKHMATQDQVDALAGRLESVAADLRGDIEALKAAHPELDLSALDSRVASLENLGAENPVVAPMPTGPEAPADQQ